MNRYLTFVGLAVCLLFSASVAKAQRCSTWSPKFDKITNPQILAKLRNFDWDRAIATAGGPEQVIASMKVTRRDAQQRLENADRAAEATKPGSGPVRYDATWDDCRSNLGAHMAAKCEHLNMTEMILYIDGSIELLKCRQFQQ
jgi:hypothetical protein